MIGYLISHEQFNIWNISYQLHNSFLPGSLGPKNHKLPNSVPSWLSRLEHCTVKFKFIPHGLKKKKVIEIIIQFAYSSRLLAIPSPDHWSAIEFQILSKFCSYRIYLISRPPFSRSKIWFLVISGKTNEWNSHQYKFPKTSTFSSWECVENTVN